MQSELSTQEKVVMFLQTILPDIQQDGGDLEFIKLEDSIVYIKFKGACVGCPFSFYTLTFGIEQRLKEAIPEISRVIAETD